MVVTRTLCSVFTFLFREERKKRDDLRYDRRKEREREWRLEELERKGVKKSKITRDKDR